MMRSDHLSQLAAYHPLLVEGRGGQDPRDPELVAQRLCENLRTHWQQRPPSKPLLLITQGDPPEQRGIAAITRVMAHELQIQRGLVGLDEAIADYHVRDADRENVVLELRYSQLVELITHQNQAAALQLRETIDQMLDAKNHRRVQMGKPALKSYFRDFARLQEFSKAGTRLLCGEITLAQTSAEIYEFSVTSFGAASLSLGLMEEADRVALPSSQDY